MLTDPERREHERKARSAPRAVGCSWSWKRRNTPTFRRPRSRSNRCARSSTAATERGCCLACAVQKALAWSEINFRRPCLLDAPAGIEDSWVLYLEFPDERPMLQSSMAIIRFADDGRRALR